MISAVSVVIGLLASVALAQEGEDIQNPFDRVKDKVKEIVSGAAISCR